MHVYFTYPYIYPHIEKHVCKFYIWTKNAHKQTYYENILLNLSSAPTKVQFVHENLNKFGTFSAY